MVDLPRLEGKHFMTTLIEHFDDVGPGWKSLLERLHVDVTAFVPDYEVEQVKEKFGALRIYLRYPADTPALDMVQGLVHTAETESQHICENCGNPGETEGLGWLKTLCPACRQRRAEERARMWSE